MKGNILLVISLAASFSIGFAARSVIGHFTPEESPLKRVTGIGGIFFKSRDPAALRTWYQDHLGLNINPYGAVFEFRQAGDSTRKGFLQWSLFSGKSTYFSPSGKDFMINYRVANLPALLIALRREGVAVVDSMQVVEYGKFDHIMDIEGNKLELWEPNDAEYEKMGKAMGLKTTY